MTERIVDLTGDENDDWLKKAYPGGIEKYRADEKKLHDEILKKHQEKQKK